jgi:cytochrome c oxidase assembly protein subunit 11
MTPNRRVALAAAAVPVLMLGLAYASVPLYALFCQVTGFGGTTQRAAQAPAEASSQSISIRFDGNASSELGWSFAPAQNTMTVKIGEAALASYVARNMTAQTGTGTAVFNVTPVTAGIYFNKIECFCFTEQTLKAGERVDMPVQFFVDPAILEDPDTRNIREITLSYSFYPTQSQAAVEQQAVKAN